MYVEELKNIEKYAEDNNIPIMEQDGIEYLTNFIKEHQIKSVLEIGSAIGYSAIKMSLVDKSIKITTIERDASRFDLAIKNIDDLDLNDQIELILGDASEIEIIKKYDLIFIDAAKSQYIKFFEKFKFNLNDKGYIISDNMDFHGLVNDTEEIKSRNLRAMIRKIKDYITFLQNNDEFVTKFIKIGDGLAISNKK